MSTAPRQSGGGAANARQPVSSTGNKPDTSFNALASLGGKMSTVVVDRHLKILFWGPTGGGKTEMVLRHFPGIVCFDVEGNTDMCLDQPEIPPFVQIKTRDIRRIQAGIEAARKPIMLPNGVPLQTIDIDSGSVLWAEQTDVAAYLAEQRAQRRNDDVETANVTQNDWTKAKRPLKRLMLEFSLTSVPFLVMTAREKDLLEEKPNGELKKIGVIPDLVKGSIYDFNLAVRLWVEGGKRMYEITKVQGSLGKIFPMGSTGTNFPIEKLFEYAKRLKPGPEESADEQDGVDLAAKIAAEEARSSMEHTQANLIKFAQEKGFSAQQLGAVLKSAGFKGFDPSQWGRMVEAVEQATLRPVASD